MQMENEKKAQLAILILDNIDFQARDVTTDKGHFIMVKGSLQ